MFLKALVAYDDQALKRGDFIPIESFHLKIDEGSRFYDAIRYQDPFNFAVSDNVYEVFKKADLSGWKTYPVIIEGREEIYHGFQVFGRSGELKRPKTTGFLVGMQFDTSTWDGSDFFIPEGTLTIFFTEKVKEILISGRFNGIQFEDIKKVKWYNPST